MNRKARWGLGLGVLGIIIGIMAYYWIISPTGTRPVVTSGKPALPTAPPPVEPGGEPRTTPGVTGGEPRPPSPAPPVAGPPHGVTKEAPSLTPAAGPPKGPEATSPPERQQEGYALLLRRYRTYRDAGKLLEKLRRQGIPGYIRQHRGKPPSYQVWAGPFPTRGEANQVARAIKKKWGISAKLRKITVAPPK